MWVAVEPPGAAKAAADAWSGHSDSHWCCHMRLKPHGPPSPCPPHRHRQRGARVACLEGAPSPLRAAQQREEGGGGGGVAAQRAVLDVVGRPAGAADDIGHRVKPLEPARHKKVEGGAKAAVKGCSQAQEQ
jgi:hypothetical protein